MRRISNVPRSRYSRILIPLAREELLFATHDVAADWSPATHSKSNMIYDNDKLEMLVEQAWLNGSRDWYPVQTLWTGDALSPSFADFRGISFWYIYVKGEDASNGWIDWKLGTSSGGTQYGSGSVNFPVYGAGRSRVCTINNYSYTGGVLYPSAFGGQAGEYVRDAADGDFYFRLYMWRDSGYYICTQLDSGVADPDWTRIRIEGSIGTGIVKVYFDSSDTDDFTPVWDANSLCGTWTSPDQSLEIPAGKTDGRYARYKIDVEDDASGNTYIDKIRIYYKPPP